MKYKKQIKECHRQGYGDVTNTNTRTWLSKKNIVLVQSPYGIVFPRLRYHMDIIHNHVRSYVTVFMKHHSYSGHGCPPSSQ